MYIIIIGGGRSGYHLAKMLSQNDHEVCVIERDSEKCRQIKEDLNVKVIHGDGAEEKFLMKAGADRAQAVVALTNNDHDNLVICQLAERHFKVERTFTLVNNPGNAELFRWLGVQYDCLSNVTGCRTYSKGNRC